MDVAKEFQSHQAEKLRVWSLGSDLKLQNVVDTQTKFWPTQMHTLYCKIKPLLQDTSNCFIKDEKMNLKWNHCWDESFPFGHRGLMFGQFMAWHLAFISFIFIPVFFGKHIPHRKNKQKRPLLEIFSPITILHFVQGLSAIKCTNPGEKGGGLVSFESGSTGFVEGAHGTLSVTYTDCPSFKSSF